MELIVVGLLSIVIIVALLRGINITIKHDYTNVNTVNEDLYDTNEVDDSEDYFKEILTEIHDLMEGDDVQG